jgi:hypothetical protein
MFDYTEVHLLVIILNFLFIFTNYLNALSNIRHSRNCRISLVFVTLAMLVSLQVTCEYGYWPVCYIPLCLTHYLTAHSIV